MNLVVRKVRGKGRGVFAGEPILKGKLVERAHVLVFLNHQAGGRIHDFTFEWDDDSSAFALSAASLFNHSYNPNLVYRMDRSKKVIEFRARRGIREKEELTINYNFDPEDKSPVGFRVR